MSYCRWHPMSYCRWSSENWRCDLYCYQDAAGGWATHVARRRYIGTIPEIDLSTIETTFASNRAQAKALKTLECRVIGLEHDGQTFRDQTLPAFKARVLALRACGYRVPDYVLTTVDDEIADGALAVVQ